MGPLAATSSSSPLFSPEQERIKLEDGIKKLSIKDTPIPLLDPSEVDDCLRDFPFPFPEKLLSVEMGKSLKDYSAVPLTPTSPLFVELNRSIARLRKNTPSENAAVQVFIDYISSVCQSTGKKRWKLLKGNVRAIFHYRNEPICIEIPQRIGRKIASINRLGTRITTYGHCAGIVNRVRGVFFKREGEISLVPGRAHASYELATKLVGGDPPPSQIVKLYNIYIRTHQRIDYVFQASKEVKGTNFGEFLQESPSRVVSRVIEHNISLHSFSNGFIVDLLGNPVDGRRDNFILTYPDPITKYFNLRFIDSDSSFFPVREFNYHKTVRFVLNALMSKGIDPKTREQLTNLNVEQFLVEWIYSLELFNTRVNDLLRRNILTESDYKKLKLPYVIAPSSLIFIYQSLQKIQSLLTHAKTPITHWEMLFQIDPRIYRLYKTLTNSYGVLTSSDFLFPRVPSEIHELEKKLHIMEKSPYLLHPKEKISKEKEPLFALLQCIHSLTPQLTPEKHEMFITLLKRIFADRLNHRPNDRFQRTQLHLAVFNHDEAVVNMLLQLGADPSIADVNGETPIHIAQYVPYGYKITRLFLSKLPRMVCCDLLAQKNKDGDTPLHLATWHDNPQIVELLICSGANVNEKNALGYTPIHLAAKHDMKKQFFKLLSYNPSINLNEISQSCPLIMALRWNATNILDSLSVLGINPESVILPDNFSEDSSDEDELYESIEELNQSLFLALSNLDDQTLSTKLYIVSIRMKIGKYHLGILNYRLGLYEFLRITDILENLDTQEHQDLLCETYSLLAKTYYRLDKWRKAIAYSTKFLEINDERKNTQAALRQAKVLFCLACCYQSLREYDKKIEYLEKYHLVTRNIHGDVPSEGYFSLQRSLIGGYLDNNDPFMLYKTKQLYLITNRYFNDEFSAKIRYELAHHCYGLKAFDAALEHLNQAKKFFRHSTLSDHQIYLENIFLLRQLIHLKKSYQNTFKRHNIILKRGITSEIKISEKILQSIGENL